MRATTPSRSDLHELSLRWGVIEADTHVKSVLAAAAQFAATAAANGVPGDNVDELEPDIRRRMKRLRH